MASQDILAGAVERALTVVGAGFGAAVGNQMGDPVAGAMVGEALAQVGQDFVARVLSPRQEARVATVLDLASAAIAEGLAEGRTVREDGFFETAPGDAAEVFEGVMLAARDEHEARKLPYLANLLAEVGFNQEVSVDAATLAIRAAEELTWLEMRLLSIVSRPDEFPLPETDTGIAGRSWGEWTVSQTFSDLREKGMLVSPRGETAALKLITLDLKANRLRLTNRAKLLIGLMRIDSIPAAELQETYETLVDTTNQVAERKAEQRAE